MPYAIWLSKWSASSSLSNDASSRCRQLCNSESASCESERIVAHGRMRADYRRELSRLAAAWSEPVTKSWPNRVINADSISKELVSLGEKVKALIDVFLVTLHCQRRSS
jgi:hypothetical protein